MLDHLFEENPHVREELEPDEIAFIKDLIIGESENSGKPQFLYQIINNKSYNIDVDKWDYLARDSHFLGIGKSFDHERMIKMSRVIGNEICYRDKTVDNFFDMFYSRYRLHKTAYQHKTVLLFNKLLGDAFRSADRHLGIFENVNHMRRFTYFTDSILEEILKNEDNENLREARNTLNDIIKRSYRYIGTVEDGNDQGEEPGNIVCEANFDYGAGNENPLVNIPFYERGNTHESFNYNPDQLEEMLFLPGTFQLNVRYRFERI
ncbi:deoxynucleoside triphosphate triphosphohydrolase SAMHD1-like [Octopus sinensis]|uniref:Deoxynucleoside triphosphate triphosphohydrolase SAMHD1-like n=1 Tax=Octopus sinensis TaxID=2607531 RepID=A0A7E6F6L0_9MOLL|nr:deoxynucleoside triphosphate triphosphohydrolase SAMHD1-like [Octopus sinensis]XP_036362956.1 deoxynucleoside triphosphate triphosphohydrolase SAMHD1-like [Octopus sinensis]